VRSGAVRRLCVRKAWQFAHTNAHFATSSRKGATVLRSLCVADRSLGRLLEPGLAKTGSDPAAGYLGRGAAQPLKPGQKVVGADESDSGMRREDTTEEANRPALVAPVPLGVQQEHEPEAELIVELPELARRGLGLTQVARVERLPKPSLGGGFHIHRTDVRISVKGAVEGGYAAGCRQPWRSGSAAT
jgi:hypothetical protein